VEISEIDITAGVFLISAHKAIPREGYLYAIFHIFAYLKNKHNLQLIYDPTNSVID
jgi:hypothetical protein